MLDVIDHAGKGDAAARRAVTDAGYILGQTVSQFIGLVQPDAIMIAGPLAAAPAYVAACKSGLIDHCKEWSADILISDMSAQAAARWLAIGEYLIERDLNLENLKLVRAA